MVSLSNIKGIIALAITLTLAVQLHAQYYASDDTVYRYPNKGTFYHDRFHGRKTSSGEVFDQNKFTAAHWKLKFGTLILVTNNNTGKEVIVKVNDRCPKRGVIDLTRRAAYAIGIRGCQPVTLRVVTNNEHYQSRWAAQEQMFDSVPVPKKTITPAKKKSAPAPKPTSTDKHDIELGEAMSHGQAYNLIQHLPTNYRDKVSVEPITDSNHLMLTINLGLPRQQADSVCKSLQRLFPSAHLKACD